MKCIYCGEKVGFLKTAHKECELRYQADLDTCLDRFDIDRLSSMIREYPQKQGGICKHIYDRLYLITDISLLKDIKNKIHLLLENLAVTNKSTFLEVFSVVYNIAALSNDMELFHANKIDNILLSNNEIPLFSSEGDFFQEEIIQKQSGGMIGFNLGGGIGVGGHSGKIKTNRKMQCIGKTKVLLTTENLFYYTKAGKIIKIPVEDITAFAPAKEFLLGPRFDVDARGFTPYGFEIRFGIQPSCLSNLFQAVIERRMRDRKKEQSTKVEYSGADELEKYAKLRDGGLISEEEFQAKKKKILEE